MRPSAILLLAAALSGCSVMPFGLACTTDFRYGLQLEVTSAATGAAIGDARGIAIDGAYSDSLRGAEGLYFGAGERAGIYTVRFEREGFQPWQANSVMVTKGRCHVNTVQIDVELIPAP